MREPFHIPVLRDKVLDYLQIQEGDFFIDCTLGDGGHAEGILSRGGTVWGIDRDETAVSYALNRLSPFGKRFRAVRAKFLMRPRTTSRPRSSEALSSSKFSRHVSP